MSDDFQNEIRFLGIVSSPAFVREPEGNGCIERFFKTLKEQLLWVRHFRSIPEPDAAGGRGGQERAALRGDRLAGHEFNRNDRALRAAPESNFTRPAELALHGYLADHAALH